MANTRKVLTVDSINKRVREMQYAVRGPLVVRANVLGEELKSLFEFVLTLAVQAGKKLPFDEVIRCNVGNPQSVGQKPITFVRQVLALIEYPALMANPASENLFFADAIQWAKDFLASVPPGAGAYSHSQGVDIVRRKVVDFIEKRDGYPSDVDKIFVTNGASTAITMVMSALILDESSAVLIPIPQYPIYSALIALLGGTGIGYYLDEEAGWSTQATELERAYKEATDKGLNVRGMVVINPGNPTGQVLDYDDQKDIVKFCQKQRIVLLADEVYQVNVYSDNKAFNSFKKVVRDLGDDAKDVELFSFHSVSKGVYGECGHRGGYMELYNIDDGVKGELYKFASSSLCSNLPGQIVTGIMCSPPTEGCASYAQYKEETQSIFVSLKKRAEMVASTLSELEGVHCGTPQGAMYAFPKITLPEKAMEAARAVGQQPDEFYCFALLEATGICVIPGSGFKQEEGTYHFRTTFLPQEDKIAKSMKLMKAFHEDFMNKYRD